MKVKWWCELKGDFCRFWSVVSKNNPHRGNFPFAFFLPSVEKRPDYVSLDCLANNIDFYPLNFAGNINAVISKVPPLGKIFLLSAGKLGLIGWGRWGFVSACHFISRVSVLITSQWKNLLLGGQRSVGIGAPRVRAAFPYTNRANPPLWGIPRESKQNVFCLSGQGYVEAKQLRGLIFDNFWPSVFMDFRAHAKKVILANLESVQGRPAYICCLPVNLDPQAHWKFTVQLINRRQTFCPPRGL